MKVRCKFVCQNVNEETGTLSMHAVYSGSKENEEFFRYTPSASLSLATVIPLP